ncbi:hypothetical protein [Mannheimia sp. USDA-ARS-USMARC-1261]|uniref:hypothetical protein n=1 Tax=Mannheimia sp. USDA-ARS-USMARC-1261 TaxID=1432056 RepID=UPI00046D3F14|nr:hypothetical protein [Mannheimia sp. USDA-ARS-USMARC-1261]
MFENLFIWLNSFEISKNIGTSLDIATAISIIATALIYIRNQKKVSYEAIQRKNKEAEEIALIQKKEAEKLRNQRISEQGCSVLINEISNLSNCYEKISLDSNKMYRLLSPLIVQDKEYICLDPFRSIKDNNDKFQHIDFICDDNNREGVNNELEKLTISINEKVNYIASRNYVVMPILDAITNDLEKPKDKEKILYELHEFHKELSFVGYKINNWRVFWKRIWEIRDYIDNYKEKQHNKDLAKVIKSDDAYLFEGEILDSINSFIYDERLKSIFDFTINKPYYNVEALRRIASRKLQKKHGGVVSKNAVDREIVYEIFSNEGLGFSDFVRTSTEYLIDNIRGIERIFHSLLSLLSSTYYYIINNEDGNDFQKIRDVYNSKLKVNNVLDVDIVSVNKEIYSRSSKFSLIKDAINFKKFIAYEMYSKDMDSIARDYCFDSHAIISAQTWADSLGINQLSRRLGVSKKEVWEILYKINNYVSLKEIEVEHNLKLGLDSGLVRQMINKCKKNPNYQRDNAIEFIKNTVSIINKKLLSEEEMASIQRIDIDIIRNWVKNIS